MPSNDNTKPSLFAQHAEFLAWLAAGSLTFFAGPFAANAVVPVVETFTADHYGSWLVGIMGVVARVFSFVAILAVTRTLVFILVQTGPIWWPSLMDMFDGMIRALLRKGPRL